MQAPGARIPLVDLALDQALALEAAHHLRRHLDVRARLRGERDLSRALAQLVQPPRAGEENELDVRQVERPQGRGDATLPAQRGMPEQKAGAVVRMQRHQDSARSTSAASTSGKSPLISGPICGPSSSAAGPVISIR